MRLVDAMARGFQNELEKIAREKRALDLGSVGKFLKSPTGKALGLATLGIGSWEGAKKVHKDWKIGRQVRKAGGY